VIGVNAPGLSPRRAADPAPVTDAWVQALSATGVEREHAVARLHQVLLRVARAETNRRGARHGISGPELDDLAHQAAADALLGVLAKVGEFRGESRFTTWAYKFVVFEVSAKVGRHFWRDPAAPLDAVEQVDQEDRLAERFGFDPAREAEWRDLVRALRQAVQTDLTDRQRQVFTALVIDGVPLDVLAARLGTNRNALYKTMFDARRKLRTRLVADGYLPENSARRS